MTRRLQIVMRIPGCAGRPLFDGFGKMADAQLLLGQGFAKPPLVGCLVTCAARGASARRPSTPDGTWESQLAQRAAPIPRLVDPPQVPTRHARRSGHQVEGIPLGV